GVRGRRLLNPLRAALPFRLAHPELAAPEGLDHCPLACRSAQLAEPRAGPRRATRDRGGARANRACRCTPRQIRARTAAAVLRAHSSCLCDQDPDRWGPAEGARRLDGAELWHIACDHGSPGLPDARARWPAGAFVLAHL